MQTIIESSSLCKDIYQLENDFKHNLFLLKVRDTEIERCRKRIEQLLRDQKRYELSTSNSEQKISSLETHLKKQTIETRAMKLHYETIMNRLTNDVSTMKDTHEQYVRNHGHKMQRQRIELECSWRQMMDALATKHGQETTEINDRLQMELCTNSKLKTRLEEIANETHSFRTKFHEQQSYYLAKIAALETELKTVHDENVVLKDAHQTECVYFEKELKRMSMEQERFKRAGDETNAELKCNWNETRKECEQLKQQLDLSRNELRICWENREKLEEENKRLQNEFHSVPPPLRPPDPPADDGPVCTKMEHAKFDFIMQQNEVLKEVIKSIRKKRNEAMDNTDMENKVDRLEDLVKRLKLTMLNNNSQINFCS